jgi:hypothetical protein
MALDPSLECGFQELLKLDFKACTSQPAVQPDMYFPSPTTRGTQDQTAVHPKGCCKSQCQHLNGYLNPDLLKQCRLVMSGAGHMHLASTHSRWSDHAMAWLAHVPVITLALACFAARL